MPEMIVDASDLDSRAAKAKESEREAEKLIEDFLPFLHGRVAKYSLKYDEHQRDELFSVAMLAFYEAIQGYDTEKGHFIPFASRVVNGRIIDHIRGVYRHGGRTVSLEDDTELSAQSAALESISVRIYETQRRQELLVEEIEQFKFELSSWGITLDNLAEQSPKHKKVRDTYKSVVAQILRSPDILQTIQLKRYFPVKAVAEISKLPLKKLERARTYIIATLIISMGDYELLSEYIDEGRG